MEHLSGIPGTHHWFLRITSNSQTIATKPIRFSPLFNDSRNFHNPTSTTVDYSLLCSLYIFSFHKKKLSSRNFFMFSILSRRKVESFSRKTRFVRTNRFSSSPIGMWSLSFIHESKVFRRREEKRKNSTIFLFPLVVLTFFSHPVLNWIYA